MKRLIALGDSCGMAGVTWIFETDAPIDELQRLEKISQECTKNDDDAPIWYEVLEAKGYTFEYIDEHYNVSPYGTASQWLEDKYPGVVEKYCLSN